MQRLHGRKYIPVLRTREAEMKGLANVRPKDLDLLLPVLELTRSRRTPSNPGGAISKCIDRAEEILQGRPYIADLTSMTAQTSSEVSALLDPADSFRNWTDFVASSLPRNCVPAVHLTVPFDQATFAEQANRLWATNGAVAVRVPVEYPHVAEVAAALNANSAIVVLADAEYIKPSQASSAATKCHSVLSTFAGKARLAASVCSSFPSSVTVPEYGGDAHGEFDLAEVQVSEYIKANGVPGAAVAHGDYALIHPLDFEGTVTNWVPRVDVPLAEKVFYHRVRRPEGGYVEAAQRALSDPLYAPLDCWGDQNVREAAAGSPPGRSPAHWIAVRVNFHIARQAIRLR
jgi:hypothetical protein